MGLCIPEYVFESRIEVCSETFGTRKTTLYTGMCTNSLSHVLKPVQSGSEGFTVKPSRKPGVAKSHREVTFYYFHNTYYTTLLTYPREIKNSENTSAYDESGPVLTKGLPPLRLLTPTVPEEWVFGRVMTRHCDFRIVR